ncbi:nucleopolyhedrovirus P10 family protein, partial [Streptomyces pathocidini]|uniref:nucleopolyhedrovirus P10 family protein n=1 Tax=Streptomyces pathocidini TaxID=1650571 RepID=UPI0033D1B528
APAVPPPVSALPPGPVRIEAECAARALSPLPETARRLREALLGAAERGLGLDAAGADVRIVALLEGEPAPPPEGTEAGQPSETPQPEPRRERGSEGYAPVAAAVLAVPGVTRFAPMLGGLARAVRVQGVERVHVEVQLAVATSHRAVEVARAVRAAVAAAMAADTPEPVTVAVVVTAVETP